MPFASPVVPQKAQAMVLAAGRGERMRPLTDMCPKPLLEVGSKPLMQWALEALGRGGFDRVAINTGWLGNMIFEAFGNDLVLQSPSDGHSLLFNSEQSSTVLSLCYSHEEQDFGHALETAGGIARAMPLLDDVFWALASDVYAPDFVFSKSAYERFQASGKLAHLWLVPNPPHHPGGDFGLSGDGLALNMASSSHLQSGLAMYTYSTFGLYRRELFQQPFCDIAAGNPQGIQAPLAPLLRAAMDHSLVSAEVYTATWVDIGTPQRLAQINQSLQQAALGEN